MFSRAAKCSKIGTLSAEISQYLSIPGFPEIETNSLTWLNLKKSIERLHALSQIFLPCQANSVELERIFFKSGEMITKKNKIV